MAQSHWARSRRRSDHTCLYSAIRRQMNRLQLADMAQYGLEFRFPAVVIQEHQGLIELEHRPMLSIAGVVHYPHFMGRALEDRRAPITPDPGRGGPAQDCCERRARTFREH